MGNAQFATKASIPSWTYLWISAAGSPDPWPDNLALKRTIDTFTATLRAVGVSTSDCLFGQHISVNPTNQEANIDEAIHRFCHSAKNAPPKLLLVILPSVDAGIYNRVKYTCDVKEGILNVCVIASKFANGNSQYFANVALKVNLKLGARNQSLDTSRLGLLAQGKTMVVGIDVTHPSPGSSSNAPSVASIVASVDQWLGQWPGDLRIQTGRQEMVADLEGLFKSRLRLWRSKQGVLPESILIYRDGVSEGQYNQVLDLELPAIRTACKELYSATSTKQGIPKITIVIVGKRHHTRFYATKVEDADRSWNPQNGTVVDRGVTEARNWDFFLQAHSAIQGTARPAHYYIVHDEIFQSMKVTPPFTNPADVLEDLTHNLCYMFGRATKAVSICPPAYYADLACERARCYLSGVFSPSPSTTQAGSVASGGTGTGQQIDPGQVRIHENVKDSMFYI
jgi:eukaryotic translation initiation factor 2C